jgi:copper chaperone NosL
MNIRRIAGAISVWPLLAGLAGCTSGELRPVELYPEDACAMCRMAVSDPAFASEIIAEDGEALKFDDLRCMENYRREHATMKVKAIFVKDYGTKAWLPFEKSVIVRTSIETPMGSGKVAAANADEAKKLTDAFPPEPDEKACCPDCAMP